MLLETLFTFAWAIKVLNYSPNELLMPEWKTEVCFVGKAWEVEAEQTWECAQLCHSIDSLTQSFIHLLVTKVVSVPAVDKTQQRHRAENKTKDTPGPAEPNLSQRRTWHIQANKATSSCILLSKYLTSLNFSLFTYEIKVLQRLNAMRCATYLAHSRQWMEAIILLLLALCQPVFHHYPSKLFSISSAVGLLDPQAKYLSHKY